MSLDIEANRRARKYSNKELALRIIWGAIHPLFRFSPRLFYRWRVLLLRLMGAKIGRKVRIHPRTVITFPWQLQIGDECEIGSDVLIYNLGLINIGKQVTISHRAQLCAGTHDYEKATFPLQKCPITVDDFAWICTAALIGPGVTVGSGAVVGAGAVAMHDVEAWTVVGGNPASQIRRRNLHADSMP